MRAGGRTASSLAWVCVARESPGGAGAAVQLTELGFCLTSDLTP